MNANHTVDDKFQPRQTDAFVRQAGEVERAIRVADVHHHLQRQIRHVADAGALDAEVEQLGVDIAGVAFGAGDGDILIFLNAIGSITAADHRRDPQLTGDNRRVTGTPAAVGDNRRGFFHDRFPVRVGHVGNQYVAWLNAIHLADIVDHLDRTGANAVADGAPFGDDLPLSVEGITLHHLAAGTHGFRTRLDDKQLTGVAIFRPLDIHRTAVVLLDLHRLLRQLLHFLVA